MRSMTAGLAKVRNELPPQNCHLCIHFWPPFKSGPIESLLQEWQGSEDVPVSWGISGHLALHPLLL
jgi:hypothetical protein